MSTTQPIRMMQRGPGLANLLGRVSDGLGQGLLPVEVFNDDAPTSRNKARPRRTRSRRS